MASKGQYWSDRIRFSRAVGDLAVDKPEQRSLAGPDFPGRIREKDIAGTRRNLLGKKLLQEEQYPSIRIRSDGITGNMPEIGVEATVTVRGEEFTIVFPAQVDMSGDSIVASGQLELSHRDLGLKPFKAVLGTLRVRDMLILQYEITGVREVAAGQIAP
jgi:polyisoprenoid-binding protein YceI